MGLSRDRCLTIQQRGQTTPVHAQVAGDWQPPRSVCCAWSPKQPAWWHLQAAPGSSLEGALQDTMAVMDPLCSDMQWYHMCCPEQRKETAIAQLTCAVCPMST